MLLEKSKQKIPEKVTVEHKFITVDPNTEEIQSQLDQRNAELSALALKAFEDEKKSVLEKIPSNQRETVSQQIGDDPSRLESAKMNLTMRGIDTERSQSPPSGLVSSLPQRARARF